MLRHERHERHQSHQLNEHYCRAGNRHDWRRKRHCLRQTITLPLSLTSHFETITLENELTYELHICSNDDNIN